MKLYHCKKCGTFIGPYGCDELCPTCRRKETYLTKEEVVAMLEELQTKLEKEKYNTENYSYDQLLIADGFNGGIDECIEGIQCKIDKLKENNK